MSFWPSPATPFPVSKSRRAQSSWVGPRMRKTTAMSSSWAATVLTLFPDMFPGPLGHSLLGQAASNGLWRLEVRDIRDHGIGQHPTADNSPPGGGPAWGMRPDGPAAAIDAAARGDRRLFYLSPRGKPLTQG